ncbi:hypothetical protein EDC04DRAFT_2615574 [Pisolithus marmoratus]|nr:hypothetical protein EDC04DRAFT_2615574 [Pisolithus marmoratus]
MATDARATVINPFGGQYPDDNTTKEVVLQADGLVAANPDDRHVLRWTNGTDLDGKRYIQIVQLSVPHTQVKIDSERSLQLNTLHVLGQYTRAQRNQILAHAKTVKFNRKSHVNNCQTWMRSLLMAMVNDGLLSAEIFDKVDADVPLKKAVPELLEDVA